MENRVEKSLLSIRGQLTKLAFASVSALKKSKQALKTLDKPLCRQIISGDAEIDAMEEALEKECFSVLLLDSPFAADFLFVSSSLKMITDLERIGDYAVDVAEEVFYLPEGQKLHIDDLELLFDYVLDLLSVAVDAFLNSDLEKARSLSRLDDKIDRLFVKVRQDIAKGLGEKSIDPEEGIVASLIAKYLERVADHAVNIGEWVDYAKTGAHQNS